MNAIRLSGLLATFVVCVAQARAAETKSVVDFRRIDFEAASAAAAKEGKLVFVDFFTTWCEPCKRLDAETWTDAGVARLVNDKTVALRLDAEKEGRAIAQRYEVAAYPTLLLLKPDGTVVDRLVGFREPAQFKPEFQDALQGKSTLSRAVETLRAATAASAGLTEDMVKARYDLARVQSQEGRLQEALDGFLWCFDEGMPRVPAYTGVRLSFLLGEIDRLTERIPAARQELIVRRDNAEQRMLASASDRAAAADFAALTVTLKQPERMVEVYDMLPPGDARRTGMGFRLFQHFLKLQRYRDAIEVQSPDRLRRQFEDYKTMSARPGQSKMIEDANHRLVITTALNGIEALAGAGKLTEARELQAGLLGFDESPETLAALRQRHQRAGHPELGEPFGAVTK